MFLAYVQRLSPIFPAPCGAFPALHAISTGRHPSSPTTEDRVFVLFTAPPNTCTKSSSNWKLTANNTYGSLYLRQLLKGTHRCYMTQHIQCSMKPKNCTIKHNFKMLLVSAIIFMLTSHVVFFIKNQILILYQYILKCKSKVVWIFSGA